MSNLIQGLIKDVQPSQNFKSELLVNSSNIIQLLSQGYQNENHFVRHGVQILNNEYLITIKLFEHGEEVFEDYELIQDISYTIIKPKSVKVNYKFIFYQIILNENYSIILDYDVENEDWYLYEIHSL